MAEIIIKRAPEGMNVYCYDNITNGHEVNNTLRKIVREF